MSLARDKQGKADGRSAAAKWLLRRITEAGVRGSPEGRSWWTRWTRRLEEWVEQGLVRKSTAGLFLSVWDNWTDLDAVRHRAQVLAPLFHALADRERQHAQEAWRQRAAEVRDKVAQGSSMAFRAIKAKV
jgi:hypothetical protein